MQKTYEVTLDIYKTKNYSDIVFGQYDKGSLIKVSFTENDAAVSLSDKTAVVKLNDIYKLYCKNENDVLEIELSQSAVSVLGKNKLTISLYDSNNNIITMQNIFYHVREGVGKLEELVEDDDLVTQILSEITALHTKDDFLDDKDLELDLKIRQVDQSASEAAVYCDEIKSDVIVLRDETKGYHDTTQENTNTVIQNAQAVSTNKEAVAADAAEVATDAAEVAQNLTTVQQLAAQSAANLEEQKRVIANAPKWSTVQSVSEMNAITGMKDGDICLVVDFSGGTTAMYRYDVNDMDGDNINPEWVFLGQFQFLALNRENLLSILNLPAVATSGSYNDLSDKPNRYEQFITLSDGNFDFSVSDKAVMTLTEDTTLNITNMYNGSVALIEVYGANLLLPEGFKKSYDFDYLDIASPQHWIYVILYDGVNYHVTRSVCDA